MKIRKISSYLNNINVVFCGKGEFLSSFSYTKEYLKLNQNINIKQVQNNNLEKDLIDANVVIPFMGKITKNVLHNCKNLKLIMQFGSGLEGVDIETASKCGVKVANIPSNMSENASSCAEHIIYLTLSLMRNQYEMNESLKKGLIGVPTGKTIFGSVFLIYGYGGIGKQLNNKLLSLGAKTIVVTRHIPTLTSTNYINNENYEKNCTFILPENLYEYLSQCDVVAMCTTQNPSTIGLVDKLFLQNMKVGSFLVNVTRGGILNYQDVYESLQSNHLGGVGIDVYHTEPFPYPPGPSDYLLNHPKAIITPHIAGVTERSYRGMAKILGDNILRLQRGEELLHCVN